MKPTINHLIICCAIILGSVASYAQSNKTTGFQNDWEVFKNIQLSMNPSTYLFKSKKQVDSIIKWADKEVSQATSIIQFFKILNSFSDYQGSASNMLNLPQSYFDNLGEEALFFPLAIKWNGDRVFVNTKNDDIPIGAEIKSINNVPIDKILKDLGTYYSSNGSNVNGKMIGINNAFDIYYWLEYGNTRKFAIEYTLPLSKTIAHTTLSGVPYHTSSHLFEQRHSKPIDDNLYKTSISPSIKWELFQENAVLLTIHNLDFRTNIKDPKQLQFRKEIDSLFSYLALTPSIENLVIDIRTLRSGNTLSAAQILQYLTNKSFTLEKSAYTVSQKIAYSDFLFFKNGADNATKKDFALDWEETLRTHYSNKSGKHFLSNKKYFTSLHPAHQSKRYKGRLYLLVGPSVDNIGVHFASMLQEYAHPIIIGEETMGLSNQANYKEPIRYQLPFSKIEFQFALEQTQFDVRKSNAANKGIIPQVKVQESALDFIENRDAVMEYTIRKIAKDSK